MNKYMIIDIGNTNYKFYTVENDKIISKKIVDSPEKAEDILTGIKKIYIVSVSEKRSDKLTSILKKNRIQYYTVSIDDFINDDIEHEI
ncbi:MAG: hypothetical protein KAS39_01720, partial [Actinomycetia bacterium]|nr:hypothetical protein [Actinomycetes bacterium]